jgi:hypothetical protein
MIVVVYPPPLCFINGLLLNSAPGDGENEKQNE